MSTDLIWYAGYGSNLSAARLRLYLEGGTPLGASLGVPGSRDPSPPRDRRALEMTGSVYFAFESPTWGGGIAFYDPAGPGTSVGSAYLLSRGQLYDVAAQEMHRPPGADLDLDTLLAAGTHVFGPGRYETMHVVGAIDGHPVVTMTATWEGAVPYRAPSPAYLRTVGLGLRESQGWTATQAAAYLLARPGIGPDWDETAIKQLLAG